MLTLVLPLVGIMNIMNINQCQIHNGMYGYKVWFNGFKCNKTNVFLYVQHLTLLQSSFWKGILKKNLTRRIIFLGQCSSIFILGYFRKPDYKRGFFNASCKKSLPFIANFLLGCLLVMLQQQK
jgi:hypothetical protein